MRVGLLYGLGPDALDAAGGSYGPALAQIEEADRLGLDSVLFEEHHGARGCPAPGSLAGAAASRTRSIRVGSLNRQPTLEHPIGVAEDWAVLDNLSRGRAILGVAPGERPEEFRAAGASWEERETAFREAVELIRTAWTQLSFQFIGEHYQFPLGADGAKGWRLEPADAWVSPDRGFVPQWGRGRVDPQYLPVTPRPVQLPHPPIWVNAYRQDTVEWAARAGLAFLAPSCLTEDEVRASIGWYHDALEACGRGRNEVDVVVAREVFVAEDPEKARSVALPSLLRHVEAVRSESSDEHSGLALLDGDVDEAKLLETCAIVGSPIEVSDRLRELAVGCGITHVVCRVHLPGRDHLEVLDAIRLLAGQVKTRLQA